MFVVAFLVLFVAGAGAAWQLGYTDGVMQQARQYLDAFSEPVAEPSRGIKPAPVPAEPQEATAQAQPVDEVTPTEATDLAEAAEPAVEPEAAAVVADSGTVEFEVVSRPSGAFVSVDGKSVGRTPLKVEYEVGQKISFFSKARGYLARRHKITVSAEQSTVNLWLAPLPYVVQVVTSPAGANASAVGGGETSTPGSLQFKSMPASRKIVVSKDGYKTALGAVSRADFTEETRRMFATVNVTLQKDPAATAAPTPAEVEAAPEPASIEPPAAEVKAEVKAEAEEPAKAVEPPPEAAPAPSETPAAAAP